VDGISSDRRESGGFTLTADALGEAAVLTVDLNVFDKAAVFKAAYWATGKAFLYFIPNDQEQNGQFLRIEVRPKSLGKDSAEQLARAFGNTLVDHQTRQIVLRETSGARDAILHRAFGEGHKHLDPETLT
jgi:His-Xaa-Ser system protein HxsD